MTQRCDSVAGSQSWWGGEQWWACPCGRWNKLAQKQCGQCKIKRSYLEVLTSAPMLSPWSSRTPASYPHSCYPPSELGQVPSVVTVASSTSTTAWEADPKEEIKEVDVALQSLPQTPVFHNARQELLAQKEILKKKIIQSRPLGSQLDSCRGAVERAQRRHSECMQAVVDAQAAVEQAATDLALKKKELAELEAAVSAEAAHGNSLDCLTSALSRVMAELKTSPVVPAHITMGAEAQMTKLMQDLLLVSKHASTVASSQASQAPAAAAQCEAAPGALKEIPVPDLGETPQVQSASAAAASCGPVRRRCNTKTADPNSQPPFCPLRGFRCRVRGRWSRDRAG